MDKRRLKDFFFLSGEISTYLLSLNESSSEEGNTKKEEEKESCKNR